MSATHTLIQLLGAVALLLWGLHMVHTGIMKGFGDRLRMVVGQGMSSRSRAVLAGLGVTMLVQSSTATALIVASFAGSGLLNTVQALAIMLGADIGTTLIAQIFTLDLSLLSPLLAGLESQPMRQVVNFHTGFNLVLAIIFIILLPAAARLIEKLMPLQADDAAAPERPRFLDQSALETPVVALSCAAREALRMGEYVETMLAGFTSSLQENDATKASEMMAMDDVIDHLYEDIKLYTTHISRQEVDEAQSHRIAEILSFTTNLEHIGDITENMLDLAAKKARRQMSFSDEGLAEIIELHGRVSANLKLAMAVFMSADVMVARRLVKEKRLIGAFERRMTGNHMERLRQGRPECIETSAVHMDILRDLRRIHSHITAIAYPILDAAGELRKTRLRKKGTRTRDAGGKLISGMAG